MRLSDQLEVNLSYQRTVWGRNTSAIDAVGASAAFRTDL